MSEALAFQPGRYHLVVVDDEDNMLNVLRLTLESQGYRFSLFSDSGQAFQLLQNEPVDLVLTDFHMPGWNGLELVRNIRKFGWKGPILVMTGKSHAVSMEALSALGVSVLLEKPFSPQVLFEKIRAALLPDPNRV